MTDIQDGSIPIEENKVETLQDKITQNIDNLPQDNKNEFNNNQNPTKEEIQLKETDNENKENQDITINPEDVKKDSSRNNKPSLTHSNSNEHNHKQSFDSNELNHQKNCYTSHQTLTTSSKKKQFSSYTKTEIYNFNQSSSTRSIRTNKETEQRIEESLKRMTEQKKKHDEYMKRLREKYEEKEKEKCKPFSGTKRAKNKSQEKEVPFLERLAQNQEILRKKQEKLKEEKEKKLKEEKQKVKEKEKKISKAMVNKKINEIYEWDAKRKEKIQRMEKMKKEKEQNELKNCFKPQINNSSKKIVRKHLNRSTDSAFERLYKEDVMKRKEKNEILKTIYTPIFKPTLNKKGSSIEIRNSPPVNEYEDYMTNQDVERMLRIRVNKKRKNKSVLEL